ncbi:hypothetical protein P0082_06050 [Candidatus Haliotispira prima]|uniref:Uncharacterized protein n=1 Tax=Candidatus Haliotispira prima TaxID=3034016 RepID=A0ABY8MDQ5_9SPIO|nr:hypothetical protein P0082_06050 [Candidatus Haliotispira prima]
MKNQRKVLTDISVNSIISNIQYPISNIQYHTTLENKHLLLSLYSFLCHFLSLFFPAVLSINLLACAPIPDTSDPAAKPADISFSVTAVASSVQLEVGSIPAVTDAGTVIRLAGEAVPTKAEAQASKGYVNLSIDADSTRKFSISQHYGSNFTDGGFTLADVLAPNTKYKLYLYMPSAIDLGQTKIQGGEIRGDRVEIPFTTASLPAEGDAVWSEKFAAKEYVTSLNEYHFMESQTGLFVAYFWTPSIPLLMETTSGNSVNKRGLGSYISGTAVPGLYFYYNSGLVMGYASTVTQYIYVIGADKLASPILKDNIKMSVTLPVGPSASYINVITRY